MKKLLIFATITLVAVFALAAAGLAYAQSQTPPVQPNPNAPYGQGMMGGWGRGGMMGGRGMMGAGTGPMHEYMFAALAEGLDTTVEDLQARLDAGETPYEYAVSKGLSDEEIRTLWETAHDQALDKAVEAGLLTQEQAGWMDEHHEQMWANGYGPGSGPCHGGTAPGAGFGRGGAGRGGRWNNSAPTN